MTQCERILQYMQEVGPITQLDAARANTAYFTGGGICVNFVIRCIYVSPLLSDPSDMYSGQ